MATEEKGNLPPFEDRAAYGGFFPALWQTCVRACLHPTEFFETVGNSTNLYPALLFGVLVGWIGGVMISFWTGLLVIMAALGNSSLPPQGIDYSMGAAGAAAAIVYYLIFGWLFVLIYIFVRGLILHLLLWIFGGAKKGLTMTLRVVSYAQAPYIFAAVPCLGCIGLCIVVWEMVLEIFGLAAAHRTETWRAALAVLLPIVLCCGTVVISIGLYMYFTQPHPLR